MEKRKENIRYMGAGKWISRELPPPPRADAPQLAFSTHYYGYLLRTSQATLRGTDFQNLSRIGEGSRRGERGGGARAEKGIENNGLKGRMVTIYTGLTTFHSNPHNPPSFPVHSHPHPPRDVIVRGEKSEIVKDTVRNRWGR